MNKSQTSGYRMIWPAMATAIALAVGHPGASQANEVTVVLSEEPDIIDPCHSSRSNIGRVVKQNVTETLTEIDPKDGSITPRLATAWEQVDDTTWRFTLREGVTFHDGEAFNAEAAAASINRTLDESIDCEIRTKFFGGMQVTPKAVDDYTLEVTTDVPVPILPTMMGTMTITSPNTVVGELTRDPIGTGPFRFASWDVGEQITLERFEDYWDDAPDVEKATYVWRTESAVRAAMVATGEADMTLERMDAIVRTVGERVQRKGGLWDLVVGGVRLTIVTDTHADRMRIVAAIVKEPEMSDEQRRKVMDANFHTALDARYATSHGVLFAAFIHPLSPLRSAELRSGILQVATLVKTFGSTYSSSGLMFGSPDESGESI